jgi:dihydrofolate reductase
MKIIQVVAASTNNAIGKNNQLLWHLPADLKFFKNTTWGMPILMGRKTYESVGRLLPGRHNIILTSNPAYTINGAFCVTNFEQAKQQATNLGCKELYVIGGGQIYQQTLPSTHIVHLTRVHTQIDGDTFYPELPANQWQLTQSKTFEADDTHAFSYTFETWERI